MKSNVEPELYIKNTLNFVFQSLSIFFISTDSVSNQPDSTSESNTFLSSISHTTLEELL